MDITKEVCLEIENILELKNGIISIESNAENTESWDSLGHLRIIMAIEEKFNIKFKTDEISSLNSVDKLINKIEKIIE